MINLKHFEDLSLDATEFCFAKSKETTSFTLIEQKRRTILVNLDLKQETEARLCLLFAQWMNELQL